MPPTKNAPARTREWWTITFVEPVNFEVPDFHTDTDALSYVTKIRQLGDPTIEPNELVHYVETTTVEVADRYSLHADEAEDVDKIVAAVKQKMIDRGAPPSDGEEALQWAVRATLEARRDQ